jgi:Asp-tRNA(Asn)/Glu-tRNA(Gln) amidotransferase A subunit family amidase
VTRGLAFANLSEVSALLERGEVSPVELTRLMLERIGSLDQPLNAWVTVLEDRAMAEARAAEAEIAGGRRRGPLHGIPYGLKDLFETAGIKTTAGSPFLRDNVPTTTATVAAKLEAAGAVLLGKTQMLEFAFGSPHPEVGLTANPWDLTRTASGSSGGSAAAVAAGMAYFSIGTDTGGSIRSPAAWNGLVGLKATYGRVSLSGVVPLAYSLDHAGPLARTGRDAALVLSAISGHDPLDEASLDIPVPDYAAEMDRVPATVRLGVDREAIAVGVHEDVVAAVDQAISALVASGAVEVPVTLPDYEQAAWSARTAMFVEASHYHRRRITDDPEGFSLVVRTRLQRGLEISGIDYVEAQRARRRSRQETLDLLREVDVLITPTTVIPAMTVAEVWEEAKAFRDGLSQRIRFTAPVNGSGLPAVSAPAGWSSFGVPVGVQLIGRPFEEALLLALADRIVEGLGWPGRQPPAPFGEG